MDPVSAAASIIAVIQITASVLNLCNQYRQSVKQAPEEAEKIITELSSLKIVLEQVLVLAEKEKQNRNAANFSLSRLTTPGGELEGCKKNLETLQMKLTPRDGWKGVKDALTWHFKVGEFRRTLEGIGKSRDTINLAITMDNALTSLEIQDDIASLTLTSIAVQGDVAKLATAFNASSLGRQQQKALDWLGSSSSFDKHNAARRKHQATTGSWFISGKQFEQWKTQPKSILWLHGIPGCGKTILCSSAITFLAQHCQTTSRNALAYFYFDFNNLQSSTLERQLRSLLVQLATQNPAALEALVKEHNKHDDGRRSASIDVLSDLLRAMFRYYSEVFLVIDALDECSDRDELLDWLDEFIKARPSEVHLLLSSRREKDIEDVVKPVASQDVSLQAADVDSDIRLYIQNRLASDRRLKKWSGDVKLEIETTLANKVNGMFRLAECQLDMICKCNNIGSLRKELQSLPRTLEGTYDRIISSIDESYTDDALKVLQWLSFCVRPLLLTEMVDVLAIDTRDSCKFEPDLRYTDPYDILTICTSLVTLHPRKIKRDPWQDEYEDVEELRLAHFSVKEYLISDRIAKNGLPLFHLQESFVSTELAKGCLIYLNRFVQFGDLTTGNIANYPLATYAAKYWPSHARRNAQDVLGYKNYAMMVLSNKETCRNWIALFDPDSGTSVRSDLEYIDLERTVEDEEINQPIYYACLLGLTGLAIELLDSAGTSLDFDEITGAQGTLLIVAARVGDSILVQELIRRGANVDTLSSDNGSALQTAAEEGHEDVVRVLLENGADVNITGGRHNTALQAAAHRGNISIVKTLLEQGAKVNLEAGDSAFSVNALAAAAGRGHAEVLEELLQYGVDINAQGDTSFPAIQEAAGQGSLRTVKLLVSKGADIHLQNYHGGTSLLEAVRNKHVEVTDYLLAHQVNVNLGNRLIGTPLSCAAENGDLALVQKLIDAGADVNLKCGGCPTPLSAAAERGYLDVVDVLLKHGADAKSGSVLQYSMLSRRLDIAQKLIDYGAEINEYGGQFGYALQAASSKKNLKSVKFLVDNGADINARGGLYGTALQAASDSQSVAIVKYLISKGADVNARGGCHGSSLHAAAQADRDDTTMVDLLLKHKADPNIRHGWYCSAIHASIEKGNVKIMEALLNAGSDIEARFENSGTPLHFALRNERSRMAQILIERGAGVNSGNHQDNDFHEAAQSGLKDVVRMMWDRDIDLNGVSEYYGSAIHSAARYGHYDVVDFLIQHNADINFVDSDLGAPLQAAAGAGSLRTLKLLVSAGADIRCQGGTHNTPLQRSSFADEFKTVQYLLELGLDVNIEGGEYHSALQAASTGNRNVVKALLDAGARVDLYGGYYGSALNAAAQSFEGDQTILKMLLAAGADVNIRGGKYDSCVQAATQSGSLEVLEILVEAGAEVDLRGGEYGTALLATADRGDVEMFEYLLARGADIDVIGPLGTIMYHAAYGGSDLIIKKLLDLGVDVNSGWGIEGSALKMSIEGVSLRAFKLLIENGANVNEICGSKANALIAAIKQGEEEFVKILLDSGADVDLQIEEMYIWKPEDEWKVENTESNPEDDCISVSTEQVQQDVQSEADREEKDISVLAISAPKEHQDTSKDDRRTNALHEALCEDNEEIRQLILSKTTNVNAEGGIHGTALNAALATCHLGLVRQLLDRGADIRACGGLYHNALQAAVVNGELRRVELVLSYGLDVNRPGGKWGNALQTAAQGGFLDIVECLINRGANVNARGGEFLSALQAASFSGHTSTVRILVLAGADIDAYDEAQGDALQTAACEGQVEVVKFLLEKNATIHTASKKFKNALQGAVDGGFVKIIRLLLENRECLRHGWMFDEAVATLEARRYPNLVKDMQRIVNEQSASLVPVAGTENPIMTAVES